MNAATYIDILREVDKLSKDEAAKSEFRRLLESAIPEREQRVLFARHLLDIGEERPIIARRLMARFSIGESQAYRDIDKALQISPKNWETPVVQ